MQAWADRVAINDVLARFGDGVNQRDATLWASTWHEDARWYLFDDTPTVGRAAIVAAWQGALAMFPRAFMLVSQGQVVIDGGSAHGRSYCFEVGQTADGRNVRYFSCYEDDYARRDGVWAFTCRRFRLLHSEDY
ncbi:nuclear transport factor 2 family protein [Parapedomonas caeni]|jgi:ketosteroid isomerase-like protein